MMHILGISCHFHDAAAAILCDGQLVAAAEEERFSRVKHDFRFPLKAIEFCLRTAGIESADLDYVVFFEKPFLKFDRILHSSLAGFPRSRRMFQEAMGNWLGDKLWVKRLISKNLVIPPERILFSEHHLSHAASAFFCSPFEDAAVLTLDGVGEWATASVGVGRGSDLRLLSEIHFPHSLGLFYSAFTAFLGFEVNEGEYKVMGMAAFGEPRYADQVRKLLRIARDGSFELDLDYFAFQHASERSFSPRFASLFGAPRNPEEPFWPAESADGAPRADSKAGNSAMRYADIAASVQLVTEEAVLAMARYAHEVSGLDRLCLAGGVALNSRANTRILRESPFKEIFVQPAAGDSGGALGAALYAWHVVLGKPRGFTMEHAFWGAQQTPAQVSDYLRAVGVRAEQVESDSELIARVAAMLADGKVIGWMQGRFEWGPRALGHRSILADPRRAAMRETVNRKIKFREVFRPFAPSVIVERAAQYFDLPAPERQYPARYMLYVVPVRDDAREMLGAVTHCDGTARVQTVARDRDPLYYGLIESFGAATGVPVLLNTSFNLRGEPIVTTASQALSTMRRSNLDAVVVGNQIIEHSAI
jgi:carbamoyltransferase